MATATSHIRIVNGDRTSGQLHHVAKGQDSHDPAADRAMRGGMVALLAAIGIVHLHLWFAGYRNIPTIGSLFLVAVITAALLAIAATVRLNVVIAVASASFAVGTLGANVLSLLLPNGLFHFKEVGVSYSGGLAIASEVGVVALVSIWAYRRRRHGGKQNRVPDGRA